VQYVRVIAVKVLSDFLRDYRALYLLTEDSDALDPFLDPKKLIGHDKVAQAAERLNIAEEEIRGLYEDINRQWGGKLTLAW
jgi:hypothetical protein